MSRRAHHSSLLSVDAQRVGPRVVLTVVGEIDISSAGSLQQALETARDAGAPEIWLDLTGTTFLDCRGLHALLDVRAGLLAENRRLVLIRPGGPVLRLLVLTGLDRVFEIAPNPGIPHRRTSPTGVPAPQTPARRSPPRRVGVARMPDAQPAMNGGPDR